MRNVPPQYRSTKPQDNVELLPGLSIGKAMLPCTRLDRRMFALDPYLSHLVRWIRNLKRRRIWSSKSSKSGTRNQPSKPENPLDVTRFKLTPGRVRSRDIAMGPLPNSLGLYYRIAYGLDYEERITYIPNHIIGAKQSEFFLQLYKYCWPMAPRGITALSKCDKKSHCSNH